MKHNKKYSEKKGLTISFDFDGVIHKGYDGYRDGSIYGKISLGALSLMKVLVDQGFYVVISSARPRKQIYEFMSKSPEALAAGLVFECYNRTQKNPFWNKLGVVGITNHKVPAVIYIDDRAFKWTKFRPFKSFRIIGKAALAVHNKEMKKIIENYKKEKAKLQKKGNK